MDSNFVSDFSHARAVLQVFKDCDIRWYGHASFNLTRDEAMLDLMAESGCIGVNIGFESLSQKTIDSVHKVSNRTDEYADKKPLRFSTRSLHLPLKTAWRLLLR
jgi:hypothetical protein